MEYTLQVFVHPSKTRLSDSVSPDPAPAAAAGSSSMDVLVTAQFQAGDVHLEKNNTAETLRASKRQHIRLTGIDGGTVVTGATLLAQLGSRPSPSPSPPPLPTSDKVC